MHTILLKYLNIKQIIFIICCLFIVSCSEYPFIPDTGEITEDQLSVQFTVGKPEEYTILKGTNTQIERECAISEIQVLVFEGGIYKYRATGNIVSSTATSTTFNAVLRTTSAPVKLYIVANATNAITNNEPAAGSGEDDIKAAITHSFTVAGISQYFPMSGEYSIQTGLNATTINTIGPIIMLRAIARIDIFNETANFELLTVQAFRANSLIQVIPDSVTHETIPSVIAPSIPAQATVNVRTQALTVNGSSLTAQFYLPETEAPSEGTHIGSATCIIVGGFYNHSTDTTYYRIDFNSGVSGHPFGQILRNYRYVFNLIAVNGIGKDTPEEAAENQSSNITAEVKNWDENTTHMVFDGDNYFGVSTRAVVLKSAVGSSAIIDVDTDLSTYTLQWCDATGTPIQGIPSGNIQNTNFSAMISSNPSQIVISALTANTGNASQIQYLMVFAGRCKVLIKIEQVKPPDYSNVFISILSIQKQTGAFGSMVPGKVDFGNASGIRPILANANNFGPSGKVPIGGIWFDNLTTSSTNSSDFTRGNCLALMEQYDILNVVWQSDPDAGMAAAIMDWLARKPNRVLFVTHANDGNNINLCNLLGLGSTSWMGGNGTPVHNFAGYDPSNEYFTQTGPFGQVSSSFTFAGANGNWLGIKTPYTYNGQLIPLLTYTTSNVLLYIISIDINRRIVYIGDPNIYAQVTNGLNNSGATDYNQAKLIANIYAWAINQVILPGKVSQ